MAIVSMGLKGLIGKVLRLALALALALTLTLAYA